MPLHHPGPWKHRIVGGTGRLGGGTKYPERPLQGQDGRRPEPRSPPPTPPRAGWAPPSLRPLGMVGSALAPPAGPSGDRRLARSRGPGGRAGAPELAMAAAVSGVVRRLEELGDLAQAHIQHLSEAAGEDGEGAPQREAGGRG